MRTTLVLVFVSAILTCQSKTFSLRELQTIIQSTVGNEVELRNHGNGACSVIGYNAGCCQHIELDQVHLNSTVCVNVSYLPEDYGVSLTLTIDRKTIINETVSARSPPAVCAELPYTKEIASICIKFHDLDISKSAFKGCVKIIIDLAYVSIADVELGCFTIPLKGQESRFNNGVERYSVLRGQKEKIGQGYSTSLNSLISRLRKKYQKINF